MVKLKKKKIELKKQLPMTVILNSGRDMLGQRIDVLIFGTNLLSHAKVDWTTIVLYPVVIRERLSLSIVVAGGNGE